MNFGKKKSVTWFSENEGGGVNGCLELFRKFIRFWRDRLPLDARLNIQDMWTFPRRLNERFNIHISAIIPLCKQVHLCQVPHPNAQSLPYPKGQGWAFLAADQVFQTERMQQTEKVQNRKTKNMKFQNFLFSPNAFCGNHIFWASQACL